MAKPLTIDEMREHIYYAKDCAKQSNVLPEAKDMTLVETCTIADIALRALKLAIERAEYDPKCPSYDIEEECVDLRDCSNCWLRYYIAQAQGDER